MECEKPNILMHFEKTLLKCTFGKYTFKYRELELICKKLVNGENAAGGRGFDILMQFGKMQFAKI